jgi:protoporphyrinogen/coproporphyrinogen III oxidase
VIGGGITGLSAIYYMQKLLHEGNLAARLVLIEAEEKLGGKINTARSGDFIIETGADSIVGRKTNMAPLIDELGLREDVVYNATGKSFLWIDGQLKLIPEDTVFGIPLSLESLAKSELISAEGKVDALKDFYTPNKTFTKDDSVGAFLTSFLGKELVERQIAPVLSGVYSGELDDLTIASTLPYLLDYKNDHGSIIQGLHANKAKFQGTGGGKFFSFRGGLSALIDRLEERITDAAAGAEVLKGIKAERIEKTGDRYRITLLDGTSFEADFVVLSTLHTAARKLLNDTSLDPDFAQLFNRSLISVYLGFDVPDEVLPKDGTGYIVAEKGELTCDACTWTSRKWEHTSGNRRLLVRLFYKSSNPAYESLLEQPEDRLLQTALRDVETSLGIIAAPVAHAITPWHDAMPNYHIRHHEIVRSLEEKLRLSHPNVLLAGCSYYGVGIPDCVANGESTARMIVERLAAAH